jgi:hypothetical protein
MNDFLPITLDTQIEDIIEKYPQSVSYFIKKGVNPIYCSGAYPTTLGKFLDAKKFSNKEDFVKGLNYYIINI